MERRRSRLYQKIFSEINSKYLHVLTTVDKQITRSLRDGSVVTRPANTNGLWCCILLPAVLILNSLLYKVSQLYCILTCISVGLLFYCVLFIIFVSVSCLVLKETIYGGCVPASFTSALLLYAVLEQDLVFALIYSLSSVVAFSLLLRISLTKYPRTFTVGEAMIVCQSIVLFTVMSITKIIYTDIGDEEDDEMKFVNAVNFTILSSVGIIVTALYTLDDTNKNLSALGYIFSVAGTYALMILHAIIGLDCMLRLAGYIFLDSVKAKLFTFWLFMAVCAVFIIMLRTKLAVKASTVTRKTFHVLSSIVFMTGILHDLHLMTLAAGFGLGLIVLIEALRKVEIKPISPALQSAFNVYSDEKDVGSFAMTPIYLYCGLACPLILVPVHKGYELELLSGVLSIGIGDTAASWFGSKYGFNKWSAGNKTFEGTVFNIISQVAAVYALDMFGLLKVNFALFRIMVTAVISGLVEANTDQVDNLILPLVSMIAFQTTSILCFY